MSQGTEQGGDGRRVDLERKIKNSQHYTPMEMLRMIFWFCFVSLFDYASLGVRGEVKIRDINLGALQLIDGN